MTEPRNRRRRAVSLQDVVSMKPLSPESGLPLLLEPLTSGVDLFGWVERRRDILVGHLHKHGGLLFRGFGIDTWEKLERFIKACTDEPMLDYTYRSTPRSQVQNKVYTSTEYPPDQTIMMHNEASYTNTWPGKIWFCCAKAAATGGETPIADSRRVYASMPKDIRNLFTSKKVLYVRNYGPLDLPWQEVFGTGDKEAVMAYCRANGLDYEWVGDDGLRTRQICQAVTRHPITGEMVWFNQAHLFHSSALEPGIRNILREEREEEAFPRNAFFGDGSQIGDEIIARIHDVFRQHTIATPWQNGDVLFLDNVLTAHGRLPFTGKRLVLVGMTSPMQSEGSN